MFCAEEPKSRRNSTSTPCGSSSWADQIHFTLTTFRAVYRNLQHNPSMRLLLTDPDRPIHYVEAHGSLLEVILGPEGAHYVHLVSATGTPISSRHRIGPTGWCW
jgi:hypothetical protein